MYFYLNGTHRPFKYRWYTPVMAEAAVRGADQKDPNVPILNGVENKPVI